jgi:hypothetical protein
VKHQTWRPRPDDGARDLGAYEHASFVGVPGASAGPTAGVFRLEVLPQPVAGRANIALVGAGGASPDGAPSSTPLEVYTLAGRRVAVVEASSPGRWSWNPEAVFTPGVYLLRAGSVQGRLILIGR